MYQAFLIKYAEIGIKGKNRYIFEDALCKNIQTRLNPLGEFSVTKERGRIFVMCPTDYDYEDTVDCLKKVFGISGICPVVIVEDTAIENLKQQVCAYVEQFYPDKHFTFRCEARRADKNYPVTSPEICATMGECLLDRFPELSVDLHHPDTYITVEVRERAYIYSDEIPGPGGMPVGTAGKLMLLLSGGIDSPVAGYMVSKRGVAIDAVYFHAPPYTSERAKQKVIDLAKQISVYTGPINLHIINFTEIQLYIHEVCPHEELTIIMRRYMMKIAQILAEQNGCLGLVTGESIGQVASQTLQSLAATNAVCTMPVYRPLIAFDKIDIIALSEKIGTYETSIQPYEDCCTIFVAKHPVTRPSLSLIEKSELRLATRITDMIAMSLTQQEVITIV